MAPDPGAVVIGVEWTLVTLNLSLVITRVALRIFYHLQRPTLSDILVVVGWCIALNTAVLDTRLYQQGVMIPGGRTWVGSQGIHLLEIAYADDILYNIGFYFAKISLLALYYDIVSIAFVKLRMALHIITIYAVAAFLVTWGLDTFWCLPVSSNWSFDPEACRIFTNVNLAYIDWSLNMSCNLAVFILPFFILRHIQLSNKQFIGIVATFSLGIITMLCSVARFTVLRLDILTNNWAPIFLLYSLELNVSLIIVTIPLLKALIRKKKKEARVSFAGTIPLGSVPPSGDRSDIST